jgi:putative Holliday junction resolvase
MTAHDHTILAIDYGDKRVGVAYAHHVAQIPYPLLTLDNDDSLFDQLHALVVQQRAACIVVGLPRNMDGTLGSQAHKTQVFGAELAKKLKIPVHFVDETLSSIEADSAYGSAATGKSRHTHTRDSQAAALILERYFDQQRLRTQSKDTL